jgi:hypothetical protein
MHAGRMGSGSGGRRRHGGGDRRLTVRRCQCTTSGILIAQTVGVLWSLLLEV